MANQDKYDVGDTAEISADIKVTRTQALTDPATLQLIVTAPDASVTTYDYPCAQIVRDSVGKYRGLIDCTMAGVYQVFWLSTGPAKAARRMSFVVE